MNGKRSNTVFLITILISCPYIFFSACSGKSMEGMILFTQVTGNLEDIDYATGDSWRYISNSRITALNPNKPNDSLKVLTKGFFSACSPEISYDGKFMIFAAQKKQNDIWQLWEMNLENSKIRQVTSSTENCIDPTYLPGQRIVFSKFTTNALVKTGHALFTCNRDGTEIKQITYNPHAYFASTILHDGRILTISKQLYPNYKDGIFMALRPDGSKGTLFYQGLKGSNLHSRGWETNNGNVIFIASDTTTVQRTNIISINYNRPLHSTVNLSTGIKGDFYAISVLQKDKLLVSYRPPGDSHYALYEFDTTNKMLGQAIYKDKNHHALEAVLIKKRKKPKKLPSEIDLKVNSALLLCQDINFSDIQTGETTTTIPKATKIEVMGIDTALGTVAVEKDGSFYLKILADTPFRIQTINEDGDVVNGPGSWMYLRPNERRGCTGCHKGNEQVPQNKQPLSVRKDPIILPKQFKEILKNNGVLKQL